MAKLLYKYNVIMRNKATGKLTKGRHPYVAYNMKHLRDNWVNMYYDIHKITKVSNKGYKSVRDMY